MARMLFHWDFVDCVTFQWFVALNGTHTAKFLWQDRKNLDAAAPKTEVESFILCLINRTNNLQT